MPFQLASNPQSKTSEWVGFFNHSTPSPVSLQEMFPSRVSFPPIWLLWEQNLSSDKQNFELTMSMGNRESYKVPRNPMVESDSIL